MPKNRKVKNSYVKSVRRIAGKYERQAAWIGLSASVIETGTPDMIWVRLVNGQGVKAVNKLAPKVYNFPVVIARNDSGAFWEVVEVRQPYGSTTLEQMKDHHAQHEFPARDTVWVRDSQFIPLLILPAGGMTVSLFGGIVIQGSAYYTVDNQVIDLAPYQPVNGAVWALIEVISGVVTVTLSDEYITRTQLVVGVIPAGTGVRLCAIRLFTGQTEIQRNTTSTTVNDIADLRWSQGGNGDIDMLDDLLDVNAPAPTDGYYLKWDADPGEWIAAEAGDISGTGIVGQVAEFVTDTKTIQATNLIAPANLLTLVAGAPYSLTIPATGTAALLEAANIFTGTITLRTGSATAATYPIKFVSGALLGTPEVGAIEFLTDKYYGTITTGAVRKEIQIYSTYYGGFYAYEKAIVFNITVSNTYHALHLITAGDFTAGLLDGFTFNAGRAVDANITSEASGTGGRLRIVCSGAHSLTTGDLVMLGNMNNAGHNKPTRITKDGTNPTTEFLCDDIAYVAGAGASAGTVDEPAYLKASTGSDGVYHIGFTIDGTAAGSNKSWKFEVNKNITPQDNVVAKRTTTATMASMTSTGNITIAAGDKIWLSGKNANDTSDYTIENFNMNLFRL